MGNKINSIQQLTRDLAHCSSAIASNVFSGRNYLPMAPASLKQEIFSAPPKMITFRSRLKCFLHRSGSRHINSKRDYSTTYLPITSLHEFQKWTASSKKINQSTLHSIKAIAGIYTLK